MKKGFTLVEMLVVIAILGILMAMMVPAAGLILKRTRVAQAKGDAGIVVTVMLKYQAEYNRWPEFYKQEENQGKGHKTDNNWVQAMSPTPGTGAPHQDNMKRIVFFEAGGGVLNEKTGDFVDPWGNPYEYMVDLDRDGSLPDPDGEGTVRAQVIAWSVGPDGPSGFWTDNPKSWE